MVGVADYENFERFTEREKVAIRLAEELTFNPQVVAASAELRAVSAATQAAVHDHFDDQEITELVSAITAFAFLNRFNRLMDPDLDVDPVPAELMAVLK